jgi:hypothetical protein
MYAPERFLITLGPQFNLARKSDLTPRDLDESQLSIFFHEYAHYLQNISTIAGFHGFSRMLDLWRLFRETIEPNFESSGSAIMPPERQRWIEQYLVLGDAFDGAIEPESDIPFHATSIVITGYNIQPVELPLAQGTALITQVNITGNASHQSGRTEPFTFRFGTVAIMEGMAYEIDQIVAAGLDGTVTPRFDAPVFPYRLLSALAEWFAPGLPRRTILQLGCLSLCVNDPAGTLIDLFRTIQKWSARGFGAREIVDGISILTAAMRNDTFDAVLGTDLPQYRQAFRTTDVLGRGVHAIIDLFEDMLTMRRQNPFLELTILTENDHLSNEGLNKLIEQIHPCAILQQHGGSIDKVERDRLLIFVPDDGRRSMTENGISVLQACFDLLIRHLDTAGIVETASAARGRCPYYTCCNLTMRIDDPKRCKTRPWSAAGWPNWPQGNLCPYGMGVIASTPDPDFNIHRV